MLHATALILSAVLLVFVPDSLAAETYYRWKDDRGNLVVSDRPPPSEDIEYEVVSQRSTLVRRVQSGEGAVPRESTPRPGNDFNQVDATASTDEVKKNPESCSRARLNKETLESGARIRIRDDANGELRYLSDEEKVSQLERAQDIIRVHCN